MQIFQQPTGVQLAMVTALSSAYHNQETVVSVTAQQASNLTVQQRRNAKVSFYGKILSQVVITIFRFSFRRLRYEVKNKQDEQQSRKLTLQKQPLA